MLAVALGLSNAFNNPAQQAFVPEMVGRDLVPEAVALNSAQFNAGRMAGSALGGVAVAYLGVATVFFINAASFALTLGALLAMRPDELHPAAVTRPPRKGAVREGLRYAAGVPDVLFVLLALAVVGTLGFSWQVVAPLIASDVLNLGAVGFGTLMGAFGAGALIPALTLVALPGGSERRIVMAGAMIAGALLVLGWSRGRVMSVFVLLMGGRTPVGTYLLGHVAAPTSVPVAIVGFGAASGIGLIATLTYQRPPTGVARPWGHRLIGPCQAPSLIPERDLISMSPRCHAPS